MRDEDLEVRRRVPLFILLVGEVLISPHRFFDEFRYGRRRFLSSLVVVSLLSLTRTLSWRSPLVLLDPLAHWLLCSVALGLMSGGRVHRLESSTLSGLCMTPALAGELAYLISGEFWIRLAGWIWTGALMSVGALKSLRLGPAESAVAFALGVLGSTWVRRATAEALGLI